MIANKWVMRRSLSGVQLGDFHQDGAFLGEGDPNGRLLDRAVALRSRNGEPSDRHRARGGSMGSSRPARVRPSRGHLSEETVRGQLSRCPGGQPRVRARATRSFFDERLPHRTSVGTDLGLRYAIESWFVAPSSYPDKHVPVVL